jgi:hypothetical protein
LLEHNSSQALVLKQPEIVQECGEKVKKEVNERLTKEMGEKMTKEVKRKKKQEVKMVQPPGIWRMT